MTNSVEVAIIGSGPAGLAAAGYLSRQNINSCIIDEQSEPGGQIYRSLGRADSSLVSILGDDYRAGKALFDVLDSPNVRMISEASVWDINAERRIYYSQRGRAATLDAKFIILATGAMERPMPFPGWQLPGVMTAGAGQILLKSASLLPARPLVLAGSGPLLLLLATQYLRAGHHIDALIETTGREQRLNAMKNAVGAFAKPDYLGKGLSMIRALKRHGVHYIKGARELKATGDGAIDTVHCVTATGDHEISCETLLVHAGVVPNVQLSRLLGIEHRFDSLQRCWQAVTDKYGFTDIDGIAIAGDSAAITGAEAAALSGQIVAGRVLQKLKNQPDHGSPDSNADADLRKRLNRHRRFRPFIDSLYAPSAEFLNPVDETIVCRCEEINAASIREYVRLGCLGPNQTKALGRCGMGPCQGRFCGLTVSEIIAAERGVGVEDVGYYRIRPPLKPITVAEFASLDADAPIDEDQSL